MSTDALTWAFKTTIKNPGAKFVLVALSNYADENNRCFPSIGHISKMTGIAERTIHEHLIFLEEENLVKRAPRFLQNGKQTSSTYEIMSEPTHTMQNPQGMTNPQGEGDDVAAHYTKRDTEEAFEEASKGNSPLPKEEKAVDLLWTEFKALLTDNHGMEDKAARNLIGKLCSGPPKGFGSDFVHAIYDENRWLILQADEPVGYFTKVLQEQRDKTPEDRQAEQQLREARRFHQMLYQNLEYTPPFEIKNYVGRYPILAQLIEQESK